MLVKDEACFQGKGSSDWLKRKHIEKFRSPMTEKLNYSEVLPTASIVIPIHNEELNIDHLFERLFAVMSVIKVDFEIICVNDGSTDRTLSLLLEYHSLYPDKKSLIYLETAAKRSL